MAPGDLAASRATAAEAEKDRREGIWDNMTPKEVWASSAAAAEAERARWERIWDNLTPEDLAISRAVAARLKKLKRKCDRENMMLEEREAALAIRAYDKRSQYQLRDDPISLRMEELLRDRPMYTANYLAHDQETKHTIGLLAFS